jgi:serine/threonine-protein kinase
MEMVDGADLKGVISHRRDRGQTIPVEEAVLICVRICEGLAYAHELKDDRGEPLHIVHRDMSPPNVLMTRYGEVKIADFGLAKANSQLEDSQPGIIKGKFGYLSPEAAKGQSVDARADIFAVGIILWEMLAGRRLFQGQTDLETVKQVQRAEVQDIRQINSAVPESVVQVLKMALAGDPDRRYRTARALGDDLNQVLFRLPRAVSSFDIAQLVLPVEAAREAAKKHKAAQGSRIGSLIDQALFEFTSLDEGARASGSGESASPLDVHSFVGDMPGGGANEPLDWGNSLGLNTAPSAPMSDLERIEVGNLSMLEDGRSASHPAVEGVDDVEVPEPGHLPSDDLLPSDDRAPGGKGGVIALLLVLFVIGGAGGAYFSGALPEPFVEKLGLPAR